MIGMMLTMVMMVVMMMQLTTMFMMMRVMIMMMTKLRFAMTIMMDADLDKCNLCRRSYNKSLVTLRSHINFTFHDCMHALFQYVALNVIPNVHNFQHRHTISHTSTFVGVICSRSIFVGK